MSDKLNSKEQEFYFAILKLLDEQSFITARTISDTTAMPESTTRRYLTKLCKLELIRADGNNRGKSIIKYEKRTHGVLATLEHSLKYLQLTIRRIYDMDKKLLS